MTPRTNKHQNDWLQNLTDKKAPYDKNQHSYYWTQNRNDITVRNHCLKLNSYKRTKKNPTAYVMHSGFSIVVKN